MTAPRHDCGEACACAGQGVDPKLFELQARHARLLAAARAVAPKLMLWCEDCGHTIFADGRVEKSYDDDEGLCDNCTIYLEASNALRVAVAECEAGP